MATESTTKDGTSGVEREHSQDRLGFCPFNEGPCGRCPHDRESHVFHACFCLECGCPYWECAVCGGFGDI